MRWVQAERSRRTPRSVVGLDRFNAERAGLRIGIFFDVEPLQCRGDSYCHRISDLGVLKVLEIIRVSQVARHDMHFWSPESLQ